MKFEDFRDSVNGGLDRLNAAWERQSGVAKAALGAGVMAAATAVVFATPLHEYTIDPVMDFGQQVAEWVDPGALAGN